MLDTCYEACCSSWNHEEVPKQGGDHGERQASFPSNPSSPSILSSIGSWDNDEFSPPCSPSVVREMKGRFATDDMSIETTPTAVDVTMETDTSMEASLSKFGNLNLTDDGFEMMYDSPPQTPERSTQVEGHGEYGRRELHSPEIARLNSRNGNNNESPRCQRNSERIDPTDNDVLLGRGGLTNNHPGNIRFRTLVNERKWAYRKIPSRRYKVKTEFATNVMNEVHAYGGRFLEKVKAKSGTRDEWVIAKEKTARKKCSQALRE